MNTNTKIEWLPLGDVLRGKLNPRTHFDPEKIRELVASFKEHGFTAALSHLLVRPHPTLEGKYELICGERRWLAATEMRMESVPAVVSLMEDAQVLELQLVENLQREGLTPLEEAEGFRAMLALVADDGSPSHSVRSLADKIGRTEMHVRDRLGLCKLCGTLAGEALESGELTLTHARLLARVPAGKLQDDFTRRVIKPMDGMAPIPYRQLERILRDECMIELRGASFDAADPLLVPLMRSVNTGGRVAGGSCSDCLFNTKNSETPSGSKFHMCMNPECFREKQDAAHAKWRESVTDTEKGRTALGREESEQVFDISGKKLSYNSGFVDLDDLPHEHDLKRGVKEPGAWKKLIRGQGVPVVLAKDEAGKVHELADHKLALAAGRENEKAMSVDERIFTPEKVGEEKPAEGWKREERSEKDLASRAELRRKEQADRERAQKIAEAQTVAVIECARGGKVPEGFWALAVAVLLDVTDEHGDSMEVAARHGLAGAEALKKHAAKLQQPDQVALTVELLLTLYEAGERRTEALPRWAKVFGADIKQVKKTIDATAAAAEKAAAAGAKVSAGIVWDSQKENVDDFEWNGSGVCVNPDTAFLDFPKGWKVSGSVYVGRAEKGWKVGFSLNVTSGGGGSPCSQQSVSYSSRTLALKSGLLGIEARLRSHDASPSVLARVGEYVAALVAGKLNPDTAKVPESNLAPGLSRNIMDLLTAAGPAGMKVQDIAAKLALERPAMVSVWFSTTGKKLARKLAPGLYSAFPEEVPSPAAALPVAGKFSSPGFLMAKARYKADQRTFSVHVVQKELECSYEQACDLHDEVIEWGAEEASKAAQKYAPERKAKKATSKGAA